MSLHSVVLFAFWSCCCSISHCAYGFSLFCDYLQWEVAEVVLEVFYKLLRDYEPQLEDFVDQYVELQG